MNRIEILREKITKLVGLLTDKKVTVTQRGLQAYVTWDRVTGLPKVVNIPFIPDNATTEFTQAIEGFLDHEIGHVLFTDSGVVGQADKLGVGGFHNAVEDIFIENAMGNQFPGSKSNIDTMHDLFIRDYVDLNYKKNKDKPVQFLIVALLRSYANQRAFSDYIVDKLAIPEIESVDKKLSEYCRENLPKMKTSQDALDIALEIRRLLTPPAQPKQEPPPEPPQEKEPNGGSGDTPEEEGKSGPSTKDENEPEDDENETKEPPPVGNKSQDESESADDEQESESDAEGESSDEPSDSDSSDEDKDGTGEGDDEDSEGSDTSGSRGDSGDDDNNVDTDEVPTDGNSTPPNNDGSSDASENDDGVDKPEKPNESEGEDEQSSEGESTESNQGEAGGESEEGSDSTDDGEPIEVETKKMSEQGHQDLDENAMTASEVNQIQRGFVDFDEAMSELITRKAIDVAEGSDYLIYSRDFDVIEKYDVSKAKFTGSQHNPVATMQDKVDHMVGKMQRDLERAIASQNKVQWTPNHRSGRINGAALGRLIQFGDEKVFKRKEETKSQNAAVTLLIDCSASMSMYNKITTAAYTAYALSTTLERIGVNHEILGFTTKPGYCKEAVAEMQRTNAAYSRVNSLYIPIFKSFGERSNAATKLSLATLGHADWLENNVDGESLSIAAQRLSAQKEPRKILIVLSDGNPVASGGDGNKVELRAHLKKTVKDISKSGIEVLGIGIMDDAVKSYYPKHLVIQKLEDLPSTVIGQIRQLLL